MAEPRVTAVLVNWKRPGNVGKIARALRAQTVPVRLVLADCHPEAEFALPRPTQLLFDGLVRVRENIGPGSRFVPALAFAGPKYTYFHDDDALPGPRCVENFLDAADRLLDNFACLGVIGRRFRLSRSVRPYVKRNVPAPAPGVLAWVDTTVRFHFVRTDKLDRVHAFRCRFAAEYPDQAHLLVEDDLLLNLSLQALGVFPSYLVHADRGASPAMRELANPHPHSGRPWHYQFRNDFIRVARSLGWKRLRAESRTLEEARENVPTNLLHRGREHR